jgi:glycosyltransferase involved in cell wall biosynthesis
MACCDLFVLPSLYEGMPLAVLEAMAAGKPVVATAIGGTSEAVTNGVTGLLVTPGKPEDLAAAIRRLLADRELSANLARAGKQRALERFSSDAMVRGVERIYRELIDEPNERES